MARMIPATIDDSTVSDAERKVFTLLKTDPATAEWVALHSLALSRRGKKPYGEIDFVVLIPSGGVFCLEVKGGRVACRDGEWETTDRYGRTDRLRRSPFAQARESMFALRDALLNRAPVGFPPNLLFGYAVVMPDISFRELSPEWESWQGIDRDALSRSVSGPLLKLLAEYRKLHPNANAGQPNASTIRIIRQLLRPDFERVVSRGATIEDTESRLIQLTEEQFDALDLLEDNERCLFEGPAGTGKTMLALEYAKRTSKAGLRTLLICFNRLLGDWLARETAVRIQSQQLTSGSYYKLLREVIVDSSIRSEFLEQERRGSNAQLYEEHYSICGKLAVEELDRRYDVLVMDEAQDLLRPGILEVLNVWLRDGLANGRWAIFGDFRRQAIFGISKGNDLQAALTRVSPQIAKGKLRFNCRNTRHIGEETALLSGFESLPYRMGQVVGLPVDYRYYKVSGEQAGIVGAELRRLVNDGVKPADIIVISPVRLANSGVATLNAGDEFRVVDVQEGSSGRTRHQVIKFATAQAFKGMESPVVILCDIEQVGDDEPQSLLYVAMSRARSHLIVLVNARAQAAIAECVRRRLQASWSPYS